jgi:S-adenosylmethionine decarboxylase
MTVKTAVTPPAAPVTHAGVHLIIEMWQATRIDEVPHVRQTLKAAAEATGATLLGTEVHDFGDGCGVTGVAILAESHISVHSWPEYGYAAFDVFTCGHADPYRALPVLSKAFGTTDLHVVEHKRGTRLNAAAHLRSEPACA